MGLYVMALWQQPLKSKVPVARVQGHTETSYPGVPPLNDALTAPLLHSHLEQEDASPPAA